MACQHSPDDQTPRLQAGAGEDNVTDLLSSLDRVDCERHKEESTNQLFLSDRVTTGRRGETDTGGGWTSLMPSPSCRHIKTTSSQTWPKPYIKLQLPGGLFCSGFQPTVEYQATSKQTSLQRTVPEEKSMPTTSASVKRKLSSERSQCQDHRGMTTTCCPGSSKSFW